MSVKKNNFYITTTLAYVNAKPHIGFALELVRADIVARYKKLMGQEVFFNTGTDEHGAKIYEKATELKKDAREYVDEMSEDFKLLLPKLGILKDVCFIRTTDQHHILATQEFWKKVKKNGYIEKRKYQSKYCVGCELEKTDSDLIDGHCPIHPNRAIEFIDEENYFFKFSEFQKPLLEFYKNNPDFVVPSTRFNEIKIFVENGLEDFSISRLKDKMPWGVAVPNDEDHVMYVWFDALVNYISAIGWPDNEEGFSKWWPVVQYAGKDNLRQQAAMWQAMLMAANLPASKQIVLNGFVTSEGKKMSKSMGNVIDPVNIVREYSTEALRYFLARHVHPFEDSDFTEEKFKEAYNANLANGLGNLVSRILKMAEDNLDKAPEIPEHSIPQEFKDLLEVFEIQKATDFIWSKISELDEKIQKTEPFKLVKTDKNKAVALIEELVVDLYTIGRMLNPIMPETNVLLKNAIKANKKPETSLFPRKE